MNAFLASIFDHGWLLFAIAIGFVVFLAWEFGTGDMHRPAEPFTHSSTELPPPSLLAGELIAQVSQDAYVIPGESGATYPRDQVRRVVYLIRGEQRDTCRVWIRFQFTDEFTFAHVECGTRASPEEIEYAERLQAALEDKNVSTSISYDRPTPSQSELFVYSAPRIRQVV